MFDSKDNANKFLSFLNSRHDSIKFTLEFEEDNKIPFLDILLKRCPDNTFSTSVYRKKTFTGLYTKWDSFTPRKYKINLIRTLTYRCFRICSSPSLLQAAIKDGAYYCYCAYVLRISSYSNFLLPMLTNTGIFLRGLKLSGESRS